MEIIPVIDVKNGVAVAARGGARVTYAPLQTPLAAGSSDPIAVANGYFALYPFHSLYIADLDGIEGRGANPALVRSIAKAFPETELWVDNGDVSREGIGRLLGLGRVSASVGTESKLTSESLARLTLEFGDRLILSLDHLAETYLGDPQILEDCSAWPDRIIAMTLASVGMGAGPDIARLSGIAARAGLRRAYAAGGIRNISDIQAIKDAGAQGALVATALHAGQIKTGDLEEIAGW